MTPSTNISPLHREGVVLALSLSDRLSHAFSISTREFQTQGSLGKAWSLPSAFLPKTRSISQCLLNHACKHQLGLTESTGLFAVAHCLGF